MPGEGKHSKEWDDMFKALCDKGMDEESAAKIATSRVGFSADNPEVFEIADVEIFAAGKWKNEDYTAQDLDNMVHNFDLLGHKYKAPLKLGHSDKQALAQADGYPALGWVKELKRSGEKLLATFSDVPQKIKQLIDRKAYGRFSSEILWNFTFGGNVHKRVLKAVALLGADMPAVTSLSDILGLYSDSDIPQGEVHAYHDLEEIKKEGGKQMPTIEELQVQLNESNQKIAKLSQDMTSKDETIKSLEIKAQEQAIADNRKKVYLAIDEGINAGKIAPVQREHLAALSLMQFTGEEQTHKFSDGNGELKAKTSLDVLGEMIEKLPKNINFSKEISTTENPNEKTETKEEKITEGGRTYSTDAELDKKTKAIMEEKKISYTEAYKEAIQEVK
jgi:hypothetical protein